MACWKCPQALAALVYRGDPGLTVRKIALLQLPWHVQVLTWNVPCSGPSGCSSPGLGFLSGSDFLCLLFGGSVNHSGAEDSSWSTFPLMLPDPGRWRLAWLPWQSKRAGLG